MNPAYRTPGTKVWDFCLDTGRSFLYPAVG